MKSPGGTAPRFRFWVEKLVAGTITRGLIPPVFYPAISQRLLSCEYIREQSLFRKRLRDDLYWTVRVPSTFYNVSELETICETLYFKHYRPRSGDIYVNVGASYGHEVVWLLSSGVTQLEAILIEPQPSVFEALCLSFSDLPGVNCQNAAFADGRTFIQVLADDSVSATSSDRRGSGMLSVPNITADSMLTLLSKPVIDLCQVNAEGAETAIVAKLLSSEIKVKRFIIGCHDFRAKLGHGEHYRTKSQVSDQLVNAGYALSTWNTGVSHIDDWIFAERGEFP